MKFKIEEGIWAHDGSPKFDVYAVRNDVKIGYVASVDTIEQAHEKARLYKLAQEVEPKITYLEI